MGVDAPRQTVSVSPPSCVAAVLPGTVRQVRVLTEPGSRTASELSPPLPISEWTPQVRKSCPVASSATGIVRPGARSTMQTDSPHFWAQDLNTRTANLLPSSPKRRQARLRKRRRSRAGRLRGLRPRGNRMRRRFKGACNWRKEKGRRPESPPLTARKGLIRDYCLLAPKAPTIFPAVPYSV